MWTLNIWAWLLLYPSVTRKALQTFDCIELLGHIYLRADPAIDCSGDEWWFMAVLASVGVFVTCILAPIAIVQQTSRKHASSERVQRSRVALLTNTYQESSTTGRWLTSCVSCCSPPWCSSLALTL